MGASVKVTLGDALNYAWASAFARAGFRMFLASPGITHKRCVMYELNYGLTLFTGCIGVQ